MGSLLPDDLTTFTSRHNIKGKIACACSGGIDSLALAILLSKTHKVVALIIDHALRPESLVEAKKTSETLNKLGIENHVLKRGHNIKSNLQEEARKLRYDLLTGYCKTNKIKYLATAHHADDNAETFLLRLSRGSGVDGLSAIAPVSTMDGVTLIRPVLNYTKQDLVTVLKAHKVRPVEDPTNKTDKYKRNSLRFALEKLEDRELITHRINDAAENLSRVRDYLESETSKAFRKTVKIQNSNAEIDTKALAKLHEEISYRVLVKLILELAKPEQKPRFEKLKRLKTDIINGQTRTLSNLIFRPGKGKNQGKIIISIEK